MTRRSLGASALLLFALPLSQLAAAQDDKPAQEDPDSTWTFTAYLENDLVADTDKAYTNGVKFAWISQDMDYFRDSRRLPEWSYDVIDGLPFINDEGDDVMRNVAISVGQEMYTPADTQATELQLDDRPYAGYLYLGVGLQTRQPDSTDTIELQTGLIGPSSLAEETQDLVHDIRGIETAKGWDNQLGAELGFVATYQRRDKLLAANLGDTPLGMDFITHYGAALGTIHTYGNAGFQLRTGWRIPSDFGSSLIGRPGNSNAPVSRHDPRLDGLGATSVSFYVGADGRYVARNIFLDGNTFSDSHSVERKDFVREYSAGFSVINGRWKFGYRHVWRSKEFEMQDEAQEYGSFSISYSY